VTTTFHDQLTTRLLLLLQRAGKSVSGVSIEMGHSAPWLARKITPSKDARPLTTADVNEVLTHLGVPVGALLRPVLFDGDRSLLEWLREKPYRTATELNERAVLPDALDRLERQQLIKSTDSGRVSVTELANLTLQGA
jgi:hypothetical protein